MIMAAVEETVMLFNLRKKLFMSVPYVFENLVGKVIFR